MIPRPHPDMLDGNDSSAEIAAEIRDVQAGLKEYVAGLLVGAEGVAARRTYGGGSRGDGLLFDPRRPGRVANRRVRGERRRTAGDGPASYEITGPNAGRLKFGKLVAQVPPGAEGFVVEYANGKVVDLGTEFAISAPEGDGAAEVGVFRGEIRVRQGTASYEQAAPLHTGHAVRTASPSSTGLRSIPFDQDRFVRQIPTRELPWFASGSSAAIEWDVSHLVWSAGEYLGVIKWMNGPEALNLHRTELPLDPEARQQRRTSEQHRPPEPHGGQHLPLAPSPAPPAHARIGWHDDAMLAMPDDMGTYGAAGRSRAQELAWSHHQAQLTPFGGETVPASEPTAPDQVMREFKLLRITFLNRGYHPGTLNRWRQLNPAGNPLFAAVDKRLGYRWLLRRLQVPRGGGRIALELENVGFAPSFLAVSFHPASQPALRIPTPPLPPRHAAAKRILYFLSVTLYCWGFAGRREIITIIYLYAQRKPRTGALWQTARRPCHGINYSPTL